MKMLKEALYPLTEAPVRLAGKEVAIALTGHPVRGNTGGLTDAVFNLAELIG